MQTTRFVLGIIVGWAIPLGSEPAARIRIAQLILLIPAVVVATACSSDPAVRQPGLLDIDLNGTDWVLVSMNGEKPLENTNITLSFADTHLSGFAGCNGYGGPFAMEEAGAITIEEIASQAEGCIEPEGVMDQETEYLSSLLEIARFGVNGGQLELRNSLGEFVLVFTPRQSFSMDPSTLEHKWLLLAMRDSPLIEGMDITVAFSRGIVQGHAGCRDYEGLYQAYDDRIVIPAMKMLGEICDNQALLIQEGEFTDALSLTTHYRIVDDQLELFLATGDVLLFRLLLNEAGPET